jgi:hypothetical protein
MREQQVLWCTWLPGLTTSFGLVGSLESDNPSTRSFGIDMPGRLRSPPPPSVSEPRSDALVASSARMRSRSDFLCVRTPQPPQSPQKKTQRLGPMNVHRSSCLWQVRRVGEPRAHVEAQHPSPVFCGLS